MKIVICLDYSSFTERVLTTAQNFINGLKTADISIVHVIDESLFYATSGFDVQLGDGLNKESQELHELSKKHLGENIKYIEECGIPKLKIDELLEQLDYDILLVGSHSQSELEERLLGSMAEHLLRNSNKPVLIIP